MANEEHLAILGQGVGAWNQWRADSSDTVPDLSGANLRRGNLSRANLSGANLFGAHLEGAHLRRANLFGAHLEGAEIGDSTLGFGSLANLDLSTAKGLGSALHQYPSSVGVDTLALTLRGAGGRFTEEQLVFFEGAGVPHTLLEYLPSILEAAPLKFFPCFISYSTGDEAFADRLNRDLNSAGIKTWKWDRDAVPGRDLHQSIDGAIRHYDKTILICSVNSLTSPQVEPEIVAALDKEERIKANNLERRREALAAGVPTPYVDADVLIPIRLDDTIFNWDSHLKTEVSRRMISDFTDALPGGEKYRDELQKLINSLNPRAWPPQMSPANSSIKPEYLII